MTRQLPDPQFRAIAAIAQLGMGQVQVIAPLHDVVGKLVAQGETDPVRFTVFADHIQAGQLGLFAGILGKRRLVKGRAGAYHNRAVALVEPLWLRPPACPPADVHLRFPT